MCAMRRIGPALAALVRLVAPALVVAQNANNDMLFNLQRQQASVPKVLPEDQLIVERRQQPVPHMPFVMVDLNTGEPIPHDRIIELPDGKQMPARDYYRELNLVEQGLNQMGYSLREDWKSIVIQRSPVDAAQLRAGLRHINSATNEDKPFRLRTEAELEQALARQASLDRPDLTMMQSNPRLRPIELAPEGPKPIERPGSALGEALRTINVPPKEKTAPTLVQTPLRYPSKCATTTCSPPRSTAR